MSYDDRLVQLLVIERPTERVDGLGHPELDDYGQPIRDYFDVTTTRGLIQPRSAREVAEISQAGVEVSEYVAFLPIVDITTADRLRFAEADPDDLRRYELTSARDAGGLGHHLECDCKLVFSAAPALGSGALSGAMS